MMWPHENRACDSNRSKSSVFWACVNKCMIYIAPIWGPCATMMDTYSNCWRNSGTALQKSLKHWDPGMQKTKGYCTKDTPQSHIKFLSKNFLIPKSHHQIFPRCQQLALWLAIHLPMRVAPPQLCVAFLGQDLQSHPSCVCVCVWGCYSSGGSTLSLSPRYFYRYAY